MGAFFASMKTTLVGLLVAACSGASFTGVIPESWEKVVQLVCGVLIAFGFIAAKDANVSNSGTNTAPHMVEGK